jgi:cysteine sulfinate desulfinase/cysteine desulfurase-like protein
MIYFDYNATAPVMREAREAWLNVTEKIGGNPSSMHQAGTRASIALADAREKLAAYLGCHPLDLIWTSGATEANNMVTHHFPKRSARTTRFGFPPSNIRASTIQRNFISVSARN